MESAQEYWIEQDHVCPAGRHYLQQSDQVNDIAFAIMETISEHFGAYYQHTLQPGKHIFNISNSDGTHRPVEITDFNANRRKNLADLVGLLAIEFPNDFERARSLMRTLTDAFAYSPEDVKDYTWFNDFLGRTVAANDHQKRRSDVEPHYNTANALAHFACYGYGAIIVGGRENNVARTLVNAATRIDHSPHREELFGSDTSEIDTLAILEKLVDFTVAPYNGHDLAVPTKMGLFANYTIPRLRMMADQKSLPPCSSFSTYLAEAAGIVEQNRGRKIPVIPVHSLLEKRPGTVQRDVSVNPSIGFL